MLRCVKLQVVVIIIALQFYHGLCGAEPPAGDAMQGEPCKACVVSIWTKGTSGEPIPNVEILWQDLSKIDETTGGFFAPEKYSTNRQGRYQRLASAEDGFSHWTFAIEPEQRFVPDGVTVSGPALGFSGRHAVDFVFWHEDAVRAMSIHFDVAGERVDVHHGGHVRFVGLPLKGMWPPACFRQSVEPELYFTWIPPVWRQERYHWDERNGEAVVSLIPGQYRVQYYVPRGLLESRGVKLPELKRHAEKFVYAFVHDPEQCASETMECRFEIGVITLRVLGLDGKPLAGKEVTLVWPGAFSMIGKGISPDDTTYRLLVGRPQFSMPLVTGTTDSEGRFVTPKLVSSVYLIRVEGVNLIKSYIMPREFPWHFDLLEGEGKREEAQDAEASRKTATF